MNDASAVSATAAPPAAAPSGAGESQVPLDDDELKSMTEADWMKRLTRAEFKVLRQRGTEPRGGAYDHFYPMEGHFVCKGCSTPLYSASAKVRNVNLTTVRCIRLPIDAHPFADFCVRSLIRAVAGLRLTSATRVLLAPLGARVLT